MTISANEVKKHLAFELLMPRAEGMSGRGLEPRRVIDLLSTLTEKDCEKLIRSGELTKATQWGRITIYASYDKRKRIVGTRFLLTK